MPFSGSYTAKGWDENSWIHVIAKPWPLKFLKFFSPFFFNVHAFSSGVSREQALNEFTVMCRHGLSGLQRTSTQLKISERFDIKHFWILFEGIYEYKPASNSYFIKVTDLNSFQFFLGSDGSFSMFRGDRMKVNSLICSERKFGTIKLQSHQTGSSYTYKLFLRFPVEHWILI